MGNSATKHNLYMAITSDDPITTKQILQANPLLLNEPISDDSNSTPATRAAFLNRPHILAVLAQQGADLNRVGNSNISALMWGSIRGHNDCIMILLEFGANPDQVGPHQLRACDYAVLYGRYQSAWLYKEKGIYPTKTIEEYQNIRKELQTLWVDFEGFLLSLDCNIPPQAVPVFTVPPEDKTPPLVDPVPDPNETWKEWINRVKDFEEPPLVERRSLPRELQPQNTLVGKMRIFIGVDDEPRLEEVEENWSEMDSEIRMV